MERPFIFCHMMTSVDGKIMGNYMDTPEGEKTGDVFYSLAFGAEAFYPMDAWICGRITTEDNFTFYRKPALDENAPAVPEGDYVVPARFDKYYVSLDPSGKVGWESDSVQYMDTSANVIELLTGKASNAYKAFLRRMNISYIIAGEERLDCHLAVKKLYELFGVRNLMLGGGGIINWSFIREGLCDELSVVVTPSADASTATQTLFMAKEGLTEEKPVGFSVIDAKVLSGDIIWLRYKVKDSAEKG
ncbi:MAG: RibD family protein [Synergistaceae bacterium]|nr:RibD family protein [Synergistaceae bacterium]